MHELSLAVNVVNLAENAVKESAASHATSITLDVGVLAGVERSAFEFAWLAASKDTLLNAARLVYRQTPGRGRCDQCHEEFTLEQIVDPCPNCGCYQKQITGGLDFRIKSMTVV